MPMRKPMLGKYIAWTRINLLFRCTYSSLARLKRSISKGSWRYARTTRTPDNVLLARVAVWAGERLRRDCSRIGPYCERRTA